MPAPAQGRRGRGLSPGFPGDSRGVTLGFGLVIAAGDLLVVVVGIVLVIVIVGFFIVGFCIVVLFGFDEAGINGAAGVEVLHVGGVFLIAGATFCGSFGAFFALPFLFLLLVELATALVAAVSITRQCLVRPVAAVTFVTTATVAAASAATTTTATAVSVSSGLRFVDTQGATVKVGTVHSFDC